MKSLLLRCCALFIALISPLNAAMLDQGTINRVNDLRTIQSTNDQERIAGYNKKMDAAWKYFSQNKKVAIPALQQILVEETALRSPNQLVLLDVANFLAREGDSGSAVAVRGAFYRIDPAADIIRDNFQDLFLLAHRLAGEHDPRMLTAFDRMFLATESSVFVPQHAMTLDGTLICVFLYGKSGAGTLPHLLELLKSPQPPLRVLEILVWLGNADIVPAIQRTMKAHRDHETFMRATAVMMTVGGKAGRDAMLSVKPDELQPASKEYYGRVVGEIKETTYARMEKSFAAMPGYKPMDDASLKTRLVKMRESYGKDDDLHPLAILKSGLPRDELISELTRSRDRSFHRLSNEALSDVKITNALIKTLSLREK